MRNPEGTPIWYELMTQDPDRATQFYDAVIGWTVGARPSGPIDYRMIAAPDGQVGGMLRMSDDMVANGARPGWLFYVGVDDVDATVATARELGAGVIVPPSDIPGTGRFALLTDPQGAPFYVMRGASDEASGSFEPGRAGHAGWNELTTSDRQRAIAFYGALFGWANHETMEMGPAGGYDFLDLGDRRLGAAVEMKDRPAAWRFYMTVTDLDASIAHVNEGGGQIAMGPHDVPGGDRIVIGLDPEGAEFALVQPAGKKGA